MKTFAILTATVLGATLFAAGTPVEAGRPRYHSGYHHGHHHHHHHHGHVHGVRYPAHVYYAPPAYRAPVVYPVAPVYAPYPAYPAPSFGISTPSFGLFIR